MFHENILAGIPPGRFSMSAKPVVAATDGSEESLRAVDWAAREAVLRGAPLRIVSAAAMLPRMMERRDDAGLAIVTDALAQDRDLALAAATARAAQVSPDLLVDADHLTGAPAQAVAQSGSGALMLVVGSRGSGAFTALVLGSVSRYAATHAPCPVVVVRDETTSAHRQVAVGLGGPGTGGTSPPTSRSARTSSTATRAGRWPACPRAPTWSSSAGTLARTAPARSPTRCGTPRTARGGGGRRRGR